MLRGYKGQWVESQSPLMVWCDCCFPLSSVSQPLEQRACVSYLLQSVLLALGYCCVPLCDLVSVITLQHTHPSPPLRSIWVPWSRVKQGLGRHDDYGCLRQATSYQSALCHHHHHPLLQSICRHEALLELPARTRFRHLRVQRNEWFRKRPIIMIVYKSACCDCNVFKWIKF